MTAKLFRLGRPGFAHACHPGHRAAAHAAPLAQRKVLELHFGLQNGEARIDWRQTLLAYLLKHLGLE